MSSTRPSNAVEHSNLHFYQGRSLLETCTGFSWLHLLTCIEFSWFNFLNCAQFTWFDFLTCTETHMVRFPQSHRTHSVKQNGTLVVGVHGVLQISAEQVDIVVMGTTRCKYMALHSGTRGDMYMVRFPHMHRFHTARFP